MPVSREAAYRRATGGLPVFLRAKTTKDTAGRRIINLRMRRRGMLCSALNAGLLSTGSIHWYYDLESLDKSSQLNATLLQDREYIEMVNKSRGLWVDGSFHDTIVSFVG